MKTVLLAWELGAGTGHAAALHRYAASLRHHDVRLIAVVKNYVAAQGLLDLGVAILQAPPWPDAWLTPAQRAAGSSVTMGDNLAAAGLADENAFTHLLREWSDIITGVRPDLVVGDFAPAASLIARGRIPLLLTGNGFTLPPSEMAVFPPLHTLTPAVWDEARLVAAVNNAAKSAGAQPLDRLTQLFSADARVVETFALLDPYDTERVEPVDGPAFAQVPEARRPDAQGIVVYLARGVAIHPDIVGALLPFAERMNIHAPELSEMHSAQLAAAGARIQDQPIALADALPAARLAVHLGGSGVAAHALAVGVPQLVIAGHIEQELNGAALVRAGIGQMVRGYDPAVRISPETIAALLNDTALERRAIDAGTQHRATLKQSGPLEKFERAALALLGVRA